MMQQRLAWVMMALTIFVGGFCGGTSQAQDREFEIGEMVELYYGGSAYIVRTPVLRISRDGNITVQFKTPFVRNGTANVTLPSNRFWKVGDDPNPPPENEFELGENVEFYFQRTDRIAKGMVTSISTNGEYYTIHYQIRSGRTAPATAKAEAIWKKGAKKKPLPADYRPADSRPGMDASASPKRRSAKPKPFRKWTAANGKFDVQARYVSSTESTVELEKEDGSKITVELKQLSEVDNRYVANVGNNDLTRRKITEKSEIPFAKNRLKLTGSKWDFNRDTSESLDHSLPRKTVRMSEPVGFASSSRLRSNRWAPLAPGEEVSDLENRTLDYRFGQWVLARDGQRCFMIANSPFDQGCLIQGFNFATGELEFFEEIDGQGIGISTDGSKVAFLQTSNIGTERGELIIKETGPDGSVLERKIVKSFMDESGYSPTAGYFMNESVLVTMGRRFVAFDLERGTGYSTTPFPKYAILRDAAISPNRKQIAMLSDGGIFLFDVSRGKPVGALEIDNVGFGKIAFSDDGTKILYCSRHLGGIKVFDLVTGKLTKEIIAHGEHVTKSVAWPHPRFVLLDNQSLFDLELGIVVWRFRNLGSFFDPLFHMGGNTFITHDGNQSLTPVELPLDRIESAVNKFSLDDITVLKSGESFRIDLDTGFGRQDDDKIRERFEQQLGLMGLTYDENSDNVFYCTVESEAEQTAAIRMNEDDTRTVRFTPTICKIELEVDGDLKWKRTKHNTFSGGTLVGEQGEDPQQAVTRLCRPMPAFFQNARFPSRFILFPNGKDVLGESEISKNGVSDN